MIGKIATMLVKGFCSLIFRIKINGAENFPKEGGCILCANHISMWDPVIISCFMPRKIGFMGKEELKRIPVIGNILKHHGTVFVKRGSGDIGAIKSCMKSVSDGNVLGIFPTGTREIKNPNAKPKSGAALIVAKTGAMVIPVSLTANYKLFSKVYINIGKPMDYTHLKGVKQNSESLNLISNEIYGKIIENKAC